MNEREENLYNNLKNQINRIAKHNRQGSFETKERYHQANLRFAKFLSKNFGVQNYGKIKDKHIKEYASNMQERDLSPSTVKVDLSAIRFYNSQNGVVTYYDIVCTIAVL